MGTNFAVAPGEYLQEWIDGNGMSVGEFAVELGVSVAEIEDLLTGKEAIGREIACQLEQVTSIPSDSWIRFELKYREDSKRMSVGSEEPCTSSIHDELMGLFKQGGRSWVEVYALMEHVSEAELYRPELAYICQQYPICILVAVLYDTFGEMSVRLFFALLNMVAVLFIWYITFPKAGNRLLHCAVSCVFGAIIVYSLRSTPRALDILCLAVSWELIGKYIESRDIRFLFGFPFLGVFMANVHGALWPCAIMLPLTALFESELNMRARIALAVTILLTIAFAMLNPYGLDVLSLPFKTIGTSDVATVAVPELKPMFSIVPVEAVILIVISVMPVIFHAKCLGFKKTVFSFETMMISGLLFLSLMTWRNELLLLGILMIVYSTWCWKLEPKCKVSSKMLSRIVLFSISVVALEFGAVLFYSTLSATDQKSISLERAFQAMREDGAVSGTAVLTDIDPGCRAELNGFKPYLDTRIEVFNGQNGQKNVLAEAGKALSSGSLSAICDDYGMDYAVLNYGINDVGIQDLEESGFKPVYSDNLTVCLKRSTV